MFRLTVTPSFEPFISAPPRALGNEAHEAPGALT